MKRLLLGLIALASAFAIGAATSATAQTSGTIRACVGRADASPPRSVTIPDPGSGCANDNWLTWNVQGPTGPPGPTGAAGAAGATGERGPAGSLSSATAARISAKLRQVELAEARLAKARPGSAAERKALLALSRAQRQATADLVAALSG